MPWLIPSSGLLANGFLTPSPLSQAPRVLLQRNETTIAAQPTWSPRPIRPSLRASCRQLGPEVSAKSG